MGKYERPLLAQSRHSEKSALRQKDAIFQKKEGTNLTKGA